MNMFQAPTLPDVSDDKDEWPSLDQNEGAFEAQFQSKNLFKTAKYIALYIAVIGISRIIQEVALPLISLPHKGREGVKLKNMRIIVPKKD